MRRTSSLLLVSVLLSGCAEPDVCETMCDAALSRFEGCMEDRGLEWGDAVGYTDARDYANWCETWTWETRQLGEADTCADKLATFRDGDCDAYYAAWAAE